MAFDGLADAIARLPFRQRAVVVLRYYADLSEAAVLADLVVSGKRPSTPPPVAG